MALARDGSARKVIPTTFRPDHLSIRGADRDGGLDVVIVQDGRLGYRFFRLTGPPAAHIGWQVRFDPLPLLVAQPIQIPAHDPNPSPKRISIVLSQQKN